MRVVSAMTDPLDRLLREAAGERPDSEPSRRAIRAAMAAMTAGLERRRRRREARARMGRTAVLATVLLFGLIAPLGSDDFEMSIETRQKAGQEWRVFNQGLRGEEVWTSHYWTDAGLNDSSAAELLQQRASDDGVLVGMYGWQIGSNRHFVYVLEYIVDGHFVAETASVPGQSDAIPAWFKAYVGSDSHSFFVMIGETWKIRAPDLTMPMDFGDMQWVVKGWRIQLPGKEELIYYRGERADGVRSQDIEGF